MKLILTDEKCSFAKFLVFSQAVRYFLLINLTFADFKLVLLIKMVCIWDLVSDYYNLRYFLLPVSRNLMSNNGLYLGADVY